MDLEELATSAPAVKMMASLKKGQKLPHNFLRSNLVRRACKQNRLVVCDPVLTKEPPDTVRCSKAQALSPLQKESLHNQVPELVNNGFLVKMDKDKVGWVSETCIVAKPAAETASSTCINKLKQHVNAELRNAELRNAELRNAGFEHGPDLPEPSRPASALTEPQTTKARYSLVHSYAPINSYMQDTAFMPRDIAVKASKLSSKRYLFKGYLFKGYLFKGDGCAG